MGMLGFVGASVALDTGKHEAELGQGMLFGTYCHPKKGYEKVREIPNLPPWGTAIAQNTPFLNNSPAPRYDSECRYFYANSDVTAGDGWRIDNQNGEYWLCLQDNAKSGGRASEPRFVGNPNYSQKLIKTGDVNETCYKLTTVDATTTNSTLPTNK